MGIGVMGVRPRWPVVALLGLLALVTSPAPAGAVGLPGVVLSAPARVEVGAEFAVMLAAPRGQEVAGYEGDLWLDTAALQVLGVQQRDNDLRAAGRDVLLLGPVHHNLYVSLGFASCPADCVTGEALPLGTAVGKEIRLATVTLAARHPGRMQVALRNLQVVAADGSVLAVGAPAPVWVQVGDGGDVYPAPVEAPVADEAPASGVAAAAGTPLDAALAWALQREGGRCAAGGCVDVAAVQAAIAGHRGPAPRFGRLAETVPGRTWVVDSTADEPDAADGDGLCRTATGVCTLRAAITEANAHPGTDLITFRLPGDGPQTIRLTSALPNLNDLSGGTTIDGYGQPGARANTDAAISNARILVQVTGPDTLVALSVTSPQNVLRGLAFYGMFRNVYFFGPGATGNVVVGCYIGTDAAGAFGAATRRQDADGIVLMRGAAHNTIGGTAPADRNVVSGNGFHGIVTWDEGTDENLIINNLIGLHPTGERSLPNRAHGVDINSGTSYTRIGGDRAEERNVISGNAIEGVEISHGSTTVGNRIIGNFIGTNARGTAGESIGNMMGILIEDHVQQSIITGNIIGSNTVLGVRVENFAKGTIIAKNWIGVSAEGVALPNGNVAVILEGSVTNSQIGPDNTIANSPTGIRIADAESRYNTITRNSVALVTGKGIDLGPAKGAAADAARPARAANDQLAAPVVAGAAPDRAEGIACPNCAVEVFRADGAEGRNAWGRTFVASAAATSEGRFSVALRGVSYGDLLTATATDGAGNTSEFAPGVRVSVLLAPVAGATLAGYGVDLRWRPPAEATVVQVQVTPAFNDGPGVDTVLAGRTTHLEIAAPPAAYVLLPGMTYTWRVRWSPRAVAGPTDAAWGPWSEGRTFSTPAPPAAPLRLAAPAEGAEVPAGAGARLQWVASDPGLFYFEVQVSTDSAFDADPATAIAPVWWNLVHGGVTTPPNSWVTPSLAAGARYYWRIRPRVQGDGAPVPWSATANFRTAGEPG